MDVNEIEELRSRAEQGDAGAQFRFGCCLYDGFDVKKDDPGAAAWFRKAAEQGHAEAQYNLGLCYYNGTGVKMDRSEAAIWYRKAAEQGHAAARKALEKHAVAMKDKELFEKGLLLFEGKGVPRNIPEAVRCFCEAANDGNVRAICKVIDLDEMDDAEVRDAIMQYADDILKKRLEYFRKSRP
jgi:hypothetical protein